MNKVDVVVDGQFGSTGKGLLAQWLSENNKYDWHMTNAGAQAGHTSYLGDRKIVAFHLSTAGIHQRLKGGKGTQFLSAGCIIDPKVLLKEIEEFEYDTDSLWIHPNAAIIKDEHVKAENDANSGPAKMAGTGKGVGAALASKIMRQGNIAENCIELKHFVKRFGPYDLANSFDSRGILEIPQGFSLGINRMHYPAVTSRECTVMQGLADADIHPMDLDDTYMSVRTLPIRVGNTENGNSGDFYSDSKEVSWDDLGVEPELTTVTKRIRRIATFSKIQYGEALLSNRPNVIFLNFCNYLNGHDLKELIKSMHHVELDTIGTYLEHIYGFGPRVEDIRSILI